MVPPRGVDGLACVDEPSEAVAGLNRGVAKSTLDSTSVKDIPAEDTLLVATPPTSPATLHYEKGDGPLTPTEQESDSCTHLHELQLSDFTHLSCIDVSLGDRRRPARVPSGHRSQANIPSRAV